MISWIQSDDYITPILSKESSTYCASNFYKIIQNKLLKQYGEEIGSSNSLQITQ